SLEDASGQKERGRECRNRRKRYDWMRHCNAGRQVSMLWTEEFRKPPCVCPRQPTAQRTQRECFPRRTSKTKGLYRQATFAETRFVRNSPLERQQPDPHPFRKPAQWFCTQSPPESRPRTSKCPLSRENRG